MEQANQDFERAFNIIEYTNTHLFLTGRAGTGKTTFLRRLVDKSSKSVVVAAPTGIAAINAGGVTLHSLFQLDFGAFVPGMKRKPLRFSPAKLNLIKFMDVLVIDEISMVRADLLDAVDDVLRRVRNPHMPFGGVQLLLIGDLYQLPPVVTEKERPLLEENYTSPYFFSSRALAMTRFVTIELQRVFRQENADFLRLLNDVRGGYPSAETIAALNRRYVAGSNPPDEQQWVRLTSHNHSANTINSERMAALPAPEREYRCTVSGSFPDNAYPAEETLVLKQGAQVMFIKNDSTPQKRFFNGMLGTVLETGENTVTVLPADRDIPVEVEAQCWENRNYKVDKVSGEVTETVEGVFSQIPLRAAWAITIHKSQGLTFDRAIIDASACFTHGQAYVALSRCRTLEGLVLSSFIPPRAIISDTCVASFMDMQHDNHPTDETMQLLEKEYAADLLDSLFDMQRDRSVADDLHRTLADAFHSTFPSYVQNYGERVNEFETKAAKIGATFMHQYRRLYAQADSMPLITERLKAAATYFPQHIKAFVDYIRERPTEVDNAELLKRLQTKETQLLDSLRYKYAMISSLANGFSPQSFLKTKHGVLMALQGKSDKPKPEKKKPESQKISTPDEVKNPELFQKLVQWRRNEAKGKELPAFRILPTRTLIQLSNVRPTDRTEFLRVKGCGEATWTTYGEAILALIKTSEP